MSNAVTSAEGKFHFRFDKTRSQIGSFPVRPDRRQLNVRKAEALFLMFSGRQGQASFYFPKGPTVEPVAERQDEFPPRGNGGSECRTSAHRSRDDSKAL